MTTEARVDSAKSLSFVIGLAVLGPIVFLILPVYLGALYNDLGLGESQLGLLATIELLGIAVTATTGVFWSTRWDWRRTIGGALALIVVGNLVTYFALDSISYEGLLALRFAIGMAAGAMTAIMLAYLAAHPDTERASGFLVSAQTFLQVGGLYTVPVLIAAPLLGGIFLGAKGVFLAMAIFGLILLAGIRSMPRSGDAGETAADEEQGDHGHGMHAAVVLLSIALFFIAQTALWGFLELLGADSGVPADKTVLAITLSTLVAVLGPLVASYFGGRLGQFTPLLVAGVIQFVGLAILMIVEIDFVVLLVALSIFQFGWTMAIPYQYGVMADVDPTHRFIVLVSPASALGLAFGPVIAGVLIESSGYTAMYIAVGVALALYLACILPFAGKKS